MGAPLGHLMKRENHNESFLSAAGGRACSDDPVVTAMPRRQGSGGRAKSSPTANVLEDLPPRADKRSKVQRLGKHVLCLIGLVFFVNLRCALFPLFGGRLLPYCRRHDGDHEEKKEGSGGVTLPSLTTANSPAIPKTTHDTQSG